MTKSRIQYSIFWIRVCRGKFKRSAVYREFQVSISQSETALGEYRNIPAVDKHFITDDAFTLGLDGKPAVASEGQFICKYSLTRCRYLVIALQNNFKVKWCYNWCYNI